MAVIHPLIGAIVADWKSPHTASNQPGIEWVKVSGTVTVIQFAIGWMTVLSKSCHHLVQAISPALGSGLGMEANPPGAAPLLFGVAAAGCWPDCPNPSQPLIMVPSPAHVLAPWSFGFGDTGFAPPGLFHQLPCGFWPGCGLRTGIFWLLSTGLMNASVRTAARATISPPLIRADPMDAPTTSPSPAAAPAPAPPASAPTIVSAAFCIPAAAAAIVSAAPCIPPAATSTVPPDSHAQSFCAIPTSLNPSDITPVFFRISSVTASPARVSRTGLGRALTIPDRALTIAVTASAVAIVKTPNTFPRTGRTTGRDVARA